MDNKDKFIASINEGYTFKGDSILLGGAIFNGECLTGTHVKLPLKTMNRHGLIAGATGTGKTKTLQIISEGLSSKSIPVLLMDIKGDLSGLAMPGIPNPKVDERVQKIGMSYTPSGFPVELMTISEEKGVRLRATVSEFGPVLFSKILELNDTQSGIVALIFKYCDDKKLPLLDLKDFKKMLQFISEEGKKEIESEYGKISTTSTGTILRKVIELEQQHADLFFGETSFEVDDLIKISDDGKGVISIIRLTDIQSKPKLFSTFLLCLLVEIYNTFPEEGDLDQPKLVIFIDEAHLLFNEASKALLDQIETIIKLIRSKGVGIFFCTQNPTDIPDSVLSQLGMKVQHALRAFTANDRKQIKLIAANYPMSEFYNIEELLTSMGIGEAAVTVLSEKGTPTPLSATLLCPPASRMDILSPEEIHDVNSKSRLAKKYNEVIDRESAYEILTKKLQDAQEIADQVKVNEPPTSGKQEKSTVEKVLTSTTARQVGRTVARELTRGILGVLGIGGTSSSRRKKTGWF
ncbi:MAG: helicase HerA-like domain-containing protein [bacterium]|nr:helicase HerA-like domain-containing protein [bacterium]